MKVYLALLVVTCGPLGSGESWLEHQWVEGKWRYCMYLDGCVMTVKAWERCPRTFMCDE